MSEQNTIFFLPDNAKNDTKKIYKGKPRIITPVRDQVEMKMYCVDDLIPKDHKARAVWKYVKSLNLSNFLTNIQSVEARAGRSATDPHLLLSLWLYATIEGIGSGRVIERYCSEHNAFKWLCGGVSVNYHSINDFRANNKRRLNEILTQTVAIFLEAKIIDLESISQDGIRVRAHAGSGSFRRQETLEDYIIMAEEYVKTLMEEFEENPNEAIKRKRQSELTRAKEQEERLKRAARELDEIKISKEKVLKKNYKKLTEKEKSEMRVSMTDPEARKMKMANGGFNPAYNVQLASDVASKVIVGLKVEQVGTDVGLISPMHEQVTEKFDIMPKKWLADGGYTEHKDIENMAKINSGCEVLVPVKNPNNPESYQPKKDDSDVIKEWRINMGTIEVKETYKNRASTSELVNAQARNRGLQQFVVRGIEKVTSSILIFAITHNMIRAWNLLG